jgi:lipopolysaccharide assembly outer membrane protein LptD (OstA)
MKNALKPRCFGLLLGWVFLFTSFSFSQELTQIELPERPEVSDSASSDTASGDWFGSANDSTAMDTVEYHAVDLQYDVGASTFNLNDKAQLKYRTVTLDADTILYDQKGQVLQASGNPVLRETKNASLAGYRMKYNMKSRVGEVYYATTFQDNNQLNGMEVRRLPDTRLLIARGDFSTCDDTTHQHYYFYGRRMVVKPKESVTARPVVLNIADVPIAVLPMIVAPLKSGRRSGLLTPKFGGDQVQGFYIENVGFYYAPNDYWDATTAADIIEGSSANFEKTTLSETVRYKWRYRLDGNVTYKSYLEQFDFANSGYDISFNHNQNITPDGKHTLSGSGSFVSSQSVRQDNGLDAETILNQQANAQMTYSGKFGTNKSLTVKASQQYNLVTGNKERQIPDVQFRMSGQLFDFEADEDEAHEESFLDKFNYSFTNRFNLYEKVARDTVRDIDTAAWYTGYLGTYSVDYSGSLFNVINLTPKATFTGMWSGNRWINPQDSAKYRKQRSGFNPEQNEYGEFFYNHNYSLTADTKLYGIWMPEIGRFTGVRHVLSPSISYTYAPKMDTNRYFVKHPLLGQTPYQMEQKAVGFSLSNDFDIKYLKTVGRTTKSEDGKDSTTSEDTYGTRRLITTSHSTSYNFAADSLQWSDISSSFGFQVLPNYLFTIRTRHSFYHKYEEDPNKVRIPELTYWAYDLSKTFRWSGNFNAGLPSQMGKYEHEAWSASLDYRYSYSSSRVGKKVFKESVSHSTGISASLHPTKNWSMSYTTRYSYTEGRFASHEFTFDRTLHCWKIDFTWTPTGPASGWSFTVYVKDLPDIKLNAASTDDD